MSEEKRFPVGELERFIEDALKAEGVPAKDAAEVANLMVASDIAGFDAHGIFRLPIYLARIRAGGFKKTPDIKVTTDAPSVAVVDGDDGMGHLAVAFAARLAIEKAAATGIGWVGTRNSNHAGAASVYAAMPLERGMIGIYGAVGSGNHLPPWGGLDCLLSTNPIAIAIPAGDGPPVVLDFATTVASMGKIRSLAQAGKSMPEGWMIEKDGRPLTDPARADEGLLLPMGDYKGYALGLAIGLLAGTLNGAAMGEDVIKYNVELGTDTNTGQFICAIDPSKFGDASAIANQVGAVANQMRGSAAMPGFDKVRVPGDGRAERMAERSENGVEIPPSLRERLDKIASELDITPIAG